MEACFSGVDMSAAVDRDGSGSFVSKKRSPQDESASPSKRACPPVPTRECKTESPVDLTTQPEDEPRAGLRRSPRLKERERNEATSGPVTSKIWGQSLGATTEF